MTVKRHQLYSFVGIAFLFLILLLVFNTKPKKLLKEEVSRALNQKITSSEILRQEAFAQMDESEKARFRALETQIELTSDTLDKIEYQKQLSSLWFASEQYGLSGYYAEQIATLLEDDQSWGIAGTSFGIGIERAKSEKETQYCKQKSLEAFEKAISLNPENLNHQINRSVILAKYPDPSNPMKGIQLLLELNKNNPENVTIMNNLAKFALQTKQWDKAEARLQAALELEPDNLTTLCLLADLYENIGNHDKSAEFALRCNAKK